MAGSLREVFVSWPTLNTRLRDAVADLDRDVLARSAAPDRWPLWAVVGHLACQRVFWLCDFAGESGVESTPFPNATWSCPGDEDLDHALDAEHLVHALDSTFAIVARVLDTWTFDSLGESIDRTDWGSEWCHSHGFVIDRVHSHDVWHAAEASEILTSSGMPPIEPWTS